MKKFLTLILVSLISISAFAQSAKMMSDIAESETVTYTQMAYLIGTYKDLLTDDSQSESVMRTLTLTGFIPEDVNPSDIVTMGKAAQLLTKMAGIKGGVFYRLTYGAEKYALRELQARNIVPRTADVADSLSGQDMIGILYALVTYEE